MSKTIVAALELRDENDDGNENGNENGGNDGTGRSKNQRDRDDKQSSSFDNYYIILEQVSSQLKGGDDSALPQDPYVFIDCYPPGATVEASNGKLELDSTRGKEITQGVNFNGSDGVRLQYPNANIKSITPMGSALKIIEETDRDGNVNVVGYESYSPSFQYDGTTNSIVADAKIYGACRAHYAIPYERYKYTPEPTGLAPFNGGEVENLFGGLIYATRVEGLRAYATTLEVKLDPPPKPIEFARVYSHVVIDKDGPHECPEGWKKDDNTVIDGYWFNSRLKSEFPERKLVLKEELDPDNSLTAERTHLLITINANGQLFYEYYSHDYYDPFPKKLIQYMDVLMAIVFGNWQLQFYIRFPEPPGGKLAKSPESFYFDMYNLTWRDIFNRHDGNKIKAKLKENHYPNLLLEGEKPE